MSMRAPSARSGASSAGSKGSRMSRSSYRKVAHTSQVDETLFGNTNTPSAQKRRPQNSADVISMDTIEQLVGKTSLSRAADAVVINTSDLDRMRRAAKIVTEGDQADSRRRDSQMRAAKNAAARERKERMMNMESERKKNAPQTQSEIVKIQKNNSTLNKAKAKLDEDLDDVKHMNQMMAYAKCATIRDAQIYEKVESDSERQAEEVRLDALMEIERVRAIQRAAEVEKVKKVQRREGALVVVEQIKTREQMRELELEQKEIEQQMMLRHIIKMEEDDKVALEVKREEGKVLLSQVLQANQAQIEKKHEYKLLEEAEEQRRLQYIINKSAKEEAIRAEANRVKAEREAETARLRALQEKAADTKAVEDALRARRAQEASERAWRQKQLEVAQARGEKQASLAIAREVQTAEKERKLAEQAQLEKLEFERILMVQAEADSRDKQETEARRHVAVAHAREIRGQIARNEVEMKSHKSGFLLEGHKLRERVGQERAKVAAIKTRKMEELNGCGVPSKYQAELERYKISL